MTRATKVLDKVLQKLQAEVAAAGSQRVWAERHGFTPGYVSHVLCRRKSPSRKMLAALGFKKAKVVEVLYEAYPPNFSYEVEAVITEVGEFVPSCPREEP
jgi:translation initiation factor 2B subunit (eIF-2B alpha/beta/delta family)